MPKRPPRCPKTPPRWPKSPILQDFATQDGAMLPKLQGLAVIAAGVGNPPAPGRRAGCMGVFRTTDRNGRYLPLDSPRARRRPTPRLDYFYLNRPKTPPRCRFLPILPPSSWHLFSDALLECPKMPPRRPQDPPRAAQERPRAPQDAPGPQNHSKMEPKRGQDRA